MHLAVGVASSVAIVTYPVIPESIRWLSCNNRIGEAEDILKVTKAGDQRTVVQWPKC